MRYISETIVRRFLKCEEPCCNSCHDDLERVGYYMIDLDLGKERRAEVCCVIANAYDKSKGRTICVQNLGLTRQ